MKCAEKLMFFTASARASVHAGRGGRGGDLDKIPRIHCMDGAEFPRVHCGTDATLTKFVDPKSREIHAYKNLDLDIYQERNYSNPFRMM